MRWCGALSNLASKKRLVWTNLVGGVSTNLVLKPKLVLTAKTQIQTHDGTDRLCRCCGKRQEFIDKAG